MTRCLHTVATGRPKGRNALGNGFSLIELLVVLAIGAIILAFSVPAMNSILSSTSVTSAANQILGTLTLARQYAITHNRNVAVYFFKYTSTSNGLSTAYRGMQAWELGLAATQTTPTTGVTLVTTVPVTKFANIGARIVINENFSTVLNSSAGYNPNGSSTASSPIAPIPPVSVPGLPSPLVYMAFLFRPDGSTSLPLTTGGTIATSISDSGTQGTYYWTLTVCDAIAYQKAPTVLPADFATIQLDAVGGTARLLRP